MYTFVATGVPLVLLLTLVAARGVASWRGRHDAADQAEFVLTLVFSLLLAFGWGVITSVVSKTALALQAGQRAAQFEATLGDLAVATGTTFPVSFSASSYTSSLRGVIAAHFSLVGALVALIVGLAVDFGRKMRRYQRGVADGDWRGMAPRRLAKQLLPERPPKVPNKCWLSYPPRASSSSSATTSTCAPPTAAPSSTSC